MFIVCFEFLTFRHLELPRATDYRTTATPEGPHLPGSATEHFKRHTVDLAPGAIAGAGGVFIQ